MALKFVEFQEGANITATCLNNLQANFEALIQSHKHNGSEAPFIDAKQVPTFGQGKNPANQTLYDHVRDYAIHSFFSDEPTAGVYSDRLNESDYVQVGLVQDCNEWTFNGLYWEKYIPITSPYAGDYIVELQPVYNGSYTDFFSSLSPASNFSNLDSVIPLNNSLLNLNIFATNLTAEGFTVRLYALGQGTRHQLVAYDEAYMMNRRHVYVENDIAIPITGNASQGEYQIPYRGGFNYLPKKGKLAIPVDLMLNLSVQMTANKMYIYAGDSIEALPFNTGESTFFAFADSIKESEGVYEDYGFISTSSIEDIRTTKYVDELNEIQRKNVITTEDTVEVRRRFFHIINRKNKKLEVSVDRAIEMLKTEPLFIVVFEEVYSADESGIPKMRKWMFEFDQVNVINNNVIQVKTGGGTLIPRAVDDYGNIESTNVFLEGDYDVIDDSYFTLRNITFNGYHPDDLVFESGVDADTIIIGDDQLSLDEKSSLIDYDPHKIMVDNLPMVPLQGRLTPYTSQAEVDTAKSYPTLQIVTQSLLRASSERRLDSTIKTFQIRPKYFVISAKTSIIPEFIGYLDPHKQIILMKKDLTDEYRGTEDRFLMKMGRQSNINKMETYKKINTMDFMVPEVNPHFYTNLYIPKRDGEYYLAHAEVYNNTVINFVTAEDLESTAIKMAFLTNTSDRFSGSLEKHMYFSGRLKSDLVNDPLTGLAARRYYITVDSEPPTAMTLGASIRFEHIDIGDIHSGLSSLLNYIPSGFGTRDISWTYGTLVDNGWNFGSILGTIASISKQTDNTYNIYLTGVDVFKALDKRFIPADVVNINGEPTFLYPNAKIPDVYRSVEINNGAVLSLYSFNKIIENAWDTLPYSLDMNAERRIMQKGIDHDSLNHHIYVGLDLPFNYLNISMDSALGAGEVIYEYLSEDGTWNALDLLNDTTNNNELWQNDPTLLATNNFIVFNRPDILKKSYTASKRWINSSIPEFSSSRKYWVRISITIGSITPGDEIDDRFSLFPAFRNISCGSISLTDAIITLSPVGTLNGTTKELTLAKAYLEDVVPNVAGSDTILYTMLRIGDVIKMSKSGTNDSYIGYIKTKEESGLNYVITFEAIPNLDTSTINIDEIEVRRNPVAFLKNTLFDIDPHVNTVEARTNLYNPIVPYVSAGIGNSVAYSRKKQEFIGTSLDSQPDYGAASGYTQVRQCYDGYVGTDVVDIPEVDVDKFEIKARFVVSDIDPVIRTNEYIRNVEQNDFAVIAQRLWPSLYDTGSDYYNFYICKQTTDDKYYLVIYSSNDITEASLPEESLIGSPVAGSNALLGGFNGKVGYIWNDNGTIRQDTDAFRIAYNPLSPSLNLPSVFNGGSFKANLEFNQMVDAFHNGRVSSFGGRDIVGFTFNTSDVYESYETERPDFIIPEEPTVGIYKKVLPINLLTFGDVFKNKDETTLSFYYSDARTVLTKEYADLDHPEELYTINILNPTTLEHPDSKIEDIQFVEPIGNDNKYVARDSSYILKLYGSASPVGTVDAASVAFPDFYNGTIYTVVNKVNPETYFNTSIFSDITSNKSNYSQASKSAIFSNKYLDIGRSLVIRDEGSYPIDRVALSSLKNLSLSDAVNGFKKYAVDGELGDGVYYFSVPLNNIKHYNPALDGTHFGVWTKLSDSFETVNDLFMNVISDDYYEIAGKFQINPDGTTLHEKNLIWNPAKKGDKYGIFLANFTNVVQSGTDITADHGLHESFLAGGDGPTQGSKIVIENDDSADDLIIKSLQDLRRFLWGAAVYIRHYAPLSGDDGVGSITHNNTYNESLVGIIDNVELNKYGADRPQFTNYATDNIDDLDVADLFITFKDDQRLMKEILDATIKKNTAYLTYDKAYPGLEAYTYTINDLTNKWAYIPASALTSDIYPITMRQDFDISKYLSPTTQSLTSLQMMISAVDSDGDFQFAPIELDSIEYRDSLRYGGTLNVDMKPHFLPYVELNLAGIAYADASHHAFKTLVFRKPKSGLHAFIEIANDPIRTVLTGKSASYYSRFSALDDTEIENTEADPWLKYAIDAGPDVANYNSFYTALPNGLLGTLELVIVASYYNGNFRLIDQLAIGDGLDTYMSQRAIELVSFPDSDLEIRIGSASTDTGVFGGRSITFDGYNTFTDQQLGNVIYKPSIMVYPGIAIIEGTTPGELGYDDDELSGQVLGYVKKVIRKEAIFRSSPAADVGWVTTYEVELDNGRVIPPGDYYTAWVGIPIVAKVPENYTRHQFDSSDIDRHIIYTSNLAFDYNRRKVIATNNDSLFVRGPAHISKDYDSYNVLNPLINQFVKPYGRAGSVLMNALDKLTIVVDLIDFGKPSLVDNFGHTVVASLINDTNDATKMNYRLFEIINGNMKQTKAQLYQLIGDGRVYFMCIDEGAQLFMKFEPDSRNPRLGGGRPNYAPLNYDNVGQFYPIIKYAYELFNAGLYTFEAKQGRLYNKNDEHTGIDKKSPEKKWLGKIDNKYLYGMSRGSKGFDVLSRYKSYQLNSTLGLHLDANEEQGILFPYDNSSDTTPQLSQNYDAIYPGFSKFAQPHCVMYAPAVRPLLDGSVALPHFKYDVSNKAIYTMIASVPYVADLSDPVGLYDINGGLVADIEARRNLNIVKHRIRHFPESRDTLAFLFLSKDRIVDHNIYQEIYGENATGAETENIFNEVMTRLEVNFITTDDGETEVASDRDLVNSLFYRIKSHLTNLLMQNPIAKGKVEPYYYQDALGREMLGMRMPTDNYYPTIQYLAGLYRDYNIDLTPYLQLVVYNTELSTEWFRIAALFEKNYSPPRIDGKLNEIKMIEMSAPIITEIARATDAELMGVFDAGYYARVLYTSNTDGWDLSIDNSAFSFQLGPPRTGDNSADPEYYDANARNWKNDAYLADDMWWNLKYTEIGHAETASKAFTPNSVVDWKGTEEARGIGINTDGALFNYANFEKIILKERIDNGDISPSSAYQWVWIGNVAVSVYRGKYVEDHIEIKQGVGLADYETTIFSAFDYNKLTRKFDIVLDDDHLSATTTVAAITTVVYMGTSAPTTGLSVGDKYINTGKGRIWTWNGATWAGDAEPAVHDTVYNTADNKHYFCYGVIAVAGDANYYYWKQGKFVESEPTVNEVVYTEKVRAMFGVAPRITYNSAWDNFHSTLSNDYELWITFNPRVSTSTYIRPGNVPLAKLSTTFTRLFDDTDTVRMLPDTFGIELSSAPLFSTEYPYIHAFHTGPEGVFYGFQPNAVVVSAKDNIEERRGLYYFGLPTIFDYLRLPSWLIDNSLNTGENATDGFVDEEDIYLEVWTVNGWVRCPIEKNYGKINIRLPHHNYTKDFAIYQDVEYYEVLPLIPSSAKFCNTGESLPPDIGFSEHNSLYYPSDIMATYSGSFVNITYALECMEYDDDNECISEIDGLAIVSEDLTANTIHHGWLVKNSFTPSETPVASWGHAAEAANTSGGLPFLACLVDDIPCGVYYYNNEILFRWTTSEVGAGWSAINEEAIITTTNGVTILGFSLVDGKPAIVYWDTTTDKVYYARSEYADGHSGTHPDNSWTSYVVAETGVNFDGITFTYKAEMPYDNVIKTIGSGSSKTVSILLPVWENGADLHHLAVLVCREGTTTENNLNGLGVWYEKAVIFAGIDLPATIDLSGTDDDIMYCAMENINDDHISVIYAYNNVSNGIKYIRTKDMSDIQWSAAGYSVIIKTGTEVGQQTRGLSLGTLYGSEFVLHSYGKDTATEVGGLEFGVLENGSWDFYDLDSSTDTDDFVGARLSCGVSCAVIYYKLAADDKIRCDAIGKSGGSWVSSTEAAKTITLTEKDAATIPYISPIRLASGDPAFTFLELSAGDAYYDYASDACVGFGSALYRRPYKGMIVWDESMSRDGLHKAWICTAHDFVAQNIGTGEDQIPAHFDVNPQIVIFDNESVDCVNTTDDDAAECCMSLNIPFTDIINSYYPGKNSIGVEGVSGTWSFSLPARTVSPLDLDIRYYGDASVEADATEFTASKVWAAANCTNPLANLASFSDATFAAPLNLDVMFLRVPSPDKCVSSQLTLSLNYGYTDGDGNPQTITKDVTIIWHPCTGADASTPDLVLNLAECCYPVVSGAFRCSPNDNDACYCESDKYRFEYTTSPTIEECGTAPCTDNLCADVDLYIDWGDGSAETVINAPLSSGVNLSYTGDHTYAAGIYTATARLVTPASGDCISYTSPLVSQEIIVAECPVGYGDTGPFSETDCPQPGWETHIISGIIYYYDPVTNKWYNSSCTEITNPSLIGQLDQEKASAEGSSLIIQSEAGCASPSWYQYLYNGVIYYYDPITNKWYDSLCNEITDPSLISILVSGATIVGQVGVIAYVYSDVYSSDDEYLIAVGNEPFAQSPKTAGDNPDVYVNADGTPATTSDPGGMNVIVGSEGEEYYFRIVLDRYRWETVDISADIVEPTWGASTIDWGVRPIWGYYFRMLTNIGSQRDRITSGGVRSDVTGIADNDNGKGTVEHPDDRTKILRALHTTPPQFVNITRNDCWLEDVKLDGDKLLLLVAGYKTATDGVKELKTELHTIKASGKKGE